MTIPLGRYNFDGTGSGAGTAVLGIRPEHVVLGGDAASAALLDRGRASRSSSRWAPTRWSGRSSAGTNLRFRVEPETQVTGRRDASPSASIRRAPRCSTQRERQPPLDPCQRATQEKGTRDMNWSFQLYSARNFQPWDKVLKTLGRLGYKEVEGFGGVYDDPAGLRAEARQERAVHADRPFLHRHAGERFRRCARSPTRSASRLMICPYLRGRTPARRTPPAGAVSASGWPRSARRPRRPATVSPGTTMISSSRSSPTARCRRSSSWTPRPTSAGKWTSPGWCAAAPIRCRGSRQHGNRIVAVHVKDIAKPGEGLDEDGWSDVGHGTIDWARPHEGAARQDRRANTTSWSRTTRTTSSASPSARSHAVNAYLRASNMAKKLGVGIIGCGNISTTYFSLAPLFRGIEMQRLRRHQHGCGEGPGQGIRRPRRNCRRAAQGRRHRHRRQPDHSGGPLRGVASRSSTPASMSIRKSRSCCRSRKAST